MNLDRPLSEKKMSEEKKHLDFSNTRISWDRPLESYSKIQTLVGKIIRGRKFQLNKLKNNPKYYLNVGCGENVHQDFINLDLYQKDKQGETVEFPYVNKQDLQNGFTPIMAVNRVFRNHGHLFAYDARSTRSDAEENRF